MPVARAAATGFSPLDTTLDLLAQTSLTPHILEGLIRLGAALPFEQVPDLLAFFTGVAVSVETVRRWTEAAGAVQLDRETAALAEVVRTLPTSPAGPPVQQLSADGAMAPLVGGEWAEVKTLVVGSVTPTADGPRATALSYCARLADAATFSWQVTLETHRRGTATAGTVVAVQDGADWVQSLVDLQRPDAVRILDFAHAIGHLGEVAQAVFGAGTVAASEWLGQQAHALRHDDPAVVLADLAELAGAACDGRYPNAAASAGQVIEDCLGYLGSRRAQIRYAHFVAQGYPIGSGSVESANKVLVEARLKGSGMRWARANVNRVLVLRCLVRNERWTEAWPGIWHGLRQRQRRPPQLRPPQLRPPQPRPPAVASPAEPPAEPPAASPAEPLPPPRLPRTKTVVNGKPTAEHPWRRASPFPAKR